MIMNEFISTYVEAKKNIHSGSILKIWFVMILREGFKTF